MPRFRQNERADLENRVRDTATALLSGREKCCANKAASILGQLTARLERDAQCTIHQIRGSGREVHLTVSSQAVMGHIPVPINLKRVDWKAQQPATAAA